MLAIPLLLGLAVTGGRPGAGIWAVPAYLLAHLAQDALVQAAHAARRSTARDPLRRLLIWGSGYLAGATACFLALLAAAPSGSRRTVLVVALPAAAAAAIWVVDSIRHRGRALWSELIGMAGMALAAPLMAAAAGMPPQGLPLGAAAAAYGYCLSSVTCVRTFERRRSGSATAAGLDAAVHVLLLAGMALLVRAGLVPWGLPLAFVPVLIRLVLGVVRPPANLRALGMRELWVASSFVLLAMGSFWVSA
jgi:hypothetical protein